MSIAAHMENDGSATVLIPAPAREFCQDGHADYDRRTPADAAGNQRIKTRTQSSHVREESLTAHVEATKYTETIGGVVETAANVGATTASYMTWAQNCKQEGRRRQNRRKLHSRGWRTITKNEELCRSRSEYIEYHDTQRVESEKAGKSREEDDIDIEEEVRTEHDNENGAEVMSGEIDSERG